LVVQIVIVIVVLVVQIVVSWSLFSDVLGFSYLSLVLGRNPSIDSI